MGLIALFCYITSAILGIAYPCYYSFKAIKDHDLPELTRWLTFWIIFGMFKFLESVGDALLFWFPFYSELKLGFILYLVLPQSKGSIYFYRKYIHPYFKKYEGDIDSSLTKAQNEFYKQFYSWFKIAYNRICLLSANFLGMKLNAYQAGDLTQPAALEESPRTSPRRNSVFGSVFSYLKGPGQSRVAAEASVDETIAKLVSDSEIFGNEVYGSLRLPADEEIDGLDLFDSSMSKFPADESALKASKLLQQKKRDLLKLLADIDKKQHTLRRKPAAASETQGTATLSSLLGGASMIGGGILRGATYIASSISSEKLAVPNALSGSEVDDEETVLYDEARNMQTHATASEPAQSSESSNTPQRSPSSPTRTDIPTPSTSFQATNSVNSLRQRQSAKTEK